MDYTRASDIEIKAHLLDMFSKESTAIFNGTGNWAATDQIRRAGALKCLRIIMDSIMDDIDYGRERRFSRNWARILRLRKKGAGA